ncbi:MAG: BCCT family transporter [Fretibacterium sp.]|nr:BCCT family transporter [Fretibacterium sp.]
MTDNKENRNDEQSHHSPSVGPDAPVSGPGGPNFVYLISIAITLAVVAWGYLAPESFGGFANALFGGLTKYFGWGYLLTMNFFVVFCITMALSRFRNVRLGNPEDRPEYGNASWFAMLFSAGMGVGLVFYGVAEPLIHFGNVPFGAEPGSIQAARDAMQISFFHWGLHPWAGYAVIAMPMAYYQFRRNSPGLISSLFIPLVGQKAVDGAFGKLVDILAIFATLAGITTSLGLGTLQLSTGINEIMGIVKTPGFQIGIIIVLAVLYTGSAVMGIDRGIKWVANFNLLVCLALMVILFVVGPTLPIIDSLMTGVGDFISGLVKESFSMAPYGGPYESHLRNWTLYYWAWWIAWAPFVGSFVARISRGRTIAEFVAGVLIVPALGSFTWFAIFGTSALHLQLVKGIDIAAQVTKDISVGVFALYKYYPLGFIMSVLMLILITTFFVTSANSATFVLAMYSEHGEVNPSKSKMGIWGVLMAALAIVLLTTGGLQNLQTVSLTAAPPFAIIMVCACISLWRSLVRDEKEGRL